MSKVDGGFQIGLSWVYTNKPVAPPNAIEAGPGVYVFRRMHGTALVPGKLQPDKGTGSVSSDSKEWPYQDGEVLCDTRIPNSNSCYKWKSVTDGYIPKNAIVGGRAANGDTLYIARCQINGEWVSGKFHVGHTYGHFPHAGEEKHVYEYDILTLRRKET